MQERYLGRLEPGMDVCDINGDKIGTVSHVYRLQTTDAEPSVEVKTGLLGLGKHYYVPLGAVEDVTTGCVFVKPSKDTIDQQGWDQRPDYLDELN